MMTENEAQTKAQHCEDEHTSEAALMEELGRLLTDVKATARCYCTKLSAHAWAAQD